MIGWLWAQAPPSLWPHGLAWPPLLPRGRSQRDGSSRGGRWCASGRLASAACEQQGEAHNTTDWYPSMTLPSRNKTQLPCYDFTTPSPADTQILEVRPFMVLRWLCLLPTGGCINRPMMRLRQSCRRGFRASLDAHTRSRCKIGGSRFNAVIGSWAPIAVPVHCLSVAFLLWMPVAPLGRFPSSSSICGVPSPSAQRTSNSWLPATNGQS